jgi:hypothetical protein
VGNLAIVADIFWSNHNDWTAKKSDSEIEIVPVKKYLIEKCEIST